VLYSPFDLTLPVILQVRRQESLMPTKSPCASAALRSLRVERDAAIADAAKLVAGVVDARSLSELRAQLAAATTAVLCAEAIDRALGADASTSH
jgi:hypothetical protein